MMVIRRTAFLALLLVAILFAENASATFLPFSTFGDAAGWQGTTSYEENVSGGGTISGDIAFTVYDTENLVLDGEIAFADLWEKSGRYIYAYQIYSDNDILNEVRSFAIFGQNNGEPLDVAAENIGSVEDTPDSGVKPTYMGLTFGNAKAVWKFEEAGVGILDPGEHSYFLVLSSDSAPVAGNYKISADETVFPGLSPEIPEPGTLALLGIGSAMLFSRRKKSARTIKFYNRRSKR